MAQPLPAYDSTAMVEWGKVRLAEAGIEQPKLDAMLLLGHVLGMEREAFYLNSFPVSEAKALDFAGFIARRARHEPVAKILGVKEFWSLPFAVDRSTLDPRADSETLIELLLVLKPDRQAPLRLLDLGTGTGCLLLAALAEYPHASGVGIERAAETLAMARRNTQALGFADRAEMQQGDWFAGLDGRYDVILCNPPYIAASAPLMRDVAEYDPFAALYAGEDGLDDYRHLLPDIAAHLAADGVAIFEIGQGQAASVTGLAAAAGLKPHRTKHDLGGVERALAFTSLV